MALAVVEGLTYAYPGVADPALGEVDVAIEQGEVVALLGPSGSGKSTLVRALGGLVPHFHGGRFGGKAVVAGMDSRLARPADLARRVATVFQDPEDQVVMNLVRNEVAFGLENLGTPPASIWPRVEAALERVGALEIADRHVADVSGGELQRVCLAAALALEPELLLLDEPTSQLDPDGAEQFLDRVEGLGSAVLLSEHRTGRALGLAQRVLFLERGRILCDAPVDEGLAWLAEHRPSYLPAEPAPTAALEPRPPVCRVEGVTFAYRAGRAALDGVDLEVGQGEIVALEGPNGSGKTTLAKIAAGLLEPAAGSVWRAGRAGYLSQDPGRYMVRDRVLDEVALGVDGDVAAARLALEQVGLSWAAERHPRDLSSGERERLGLAAVAVAEPDLLVLDEPTRGIDPDRKSQIASWLAEYAAAGRGVLVATHDRTFPAHRRVSLGREVPIGV